ncbi:hypothetical protein LOK49_LG07G00185 [Camellia lanceoleosa]|uniref:Uncharacterized protein n=1 Tax=Camellia lanceoleosa TaxID=1840588 RepID=A0ACC0H2P0_9ERIC|nr:hypothetical protein LOK49_LG07G00185 [Camellia lanceoleosa]
MYRIHELLGVLLCNNSISQSIQQEHALIRSHASFTSCSPSVAVQANKLPPKTISAEDELNTTHMAMVLAKLPPYQVKVTSYCTTTPAMTMNFVGSFCRFYSSTKSLNIDLSDEERKRRFIQQVCFTKMPFCVLSIQVISMVISISICPSRLLYRRRQRGFLELDLILGKWVEDHINSMDENGIKSLVDVLDLWLTDQEQPPKTINTNSVFSALREKVLNNLKNHAAPETRATPRQPWLRGWDDFKKGRSNLWREESENEDHDEDMVVDATKQGDEVARALVAADALGKASLSTTSPFLLT